MSVDVPLLYLSLTKVGSCSLFLQPVPLLPRQRGKLHNPLGSYGRHLCRFSPSAGTRLLPQGHQEGGPLPDGCLVLSIMYSALVSVAWMLGLCISSLWQNCCRPPYCPQAVRPWHSPASTFCPAVTISSVTAEPASQHGGQELYLELQSNLCAVPSTWLLQKETSPFDSSYATT